MKSKIWPQQPQKWPLDLNDLGMGPVIFFGNYIFKIQGSSWEKWAIARLSSQTLKITSFYLLLGGLEVAESKTGICKSLTRKSSYSSFFPAWSLDFKNVIFEKIHWAHSEVVEVKRSFSRSPRPNFRFHLVFKGFHLEFSSFWISRSFDLGVLRMGPVNVFKNYIFEISAFKGKKWGMSQLSRKHFH